MLKLVGLALLLALALLALYAATRPDEFRVERSVVVQADAARVLALIEDLEQFNRWNPWLKKDPNTQQRYGDKRRGVGAFYGWESREIGSGTMEVVAVEPGQSVVLKLNFIKPFEAQNEARFTLRAEGTGQHLSWAMTGRNNFIGKLMGLCFNMDKMVGQDFEAGLASLKQLAETH